jgi:hypothetical protein
MPSFLVIRVRLHDARVRARAYCCTNYLAEAIALAFRAMCQTHIPDKYIFSPVALSVRTSGWCRKYDYAVIAQYSLSPFEQARCRRRRLVAFQFPVPRSALVHTNGLRQLFLGQARKDARSSQFGGR